MCNRHLRVSGVAALVALIVASSSAIAQEFSKDDKKVKPVPVEAGAVVVTPATTQIEFIGLHKGANVNPRLGGFSKYEGSIAVEDGKLKAITVGINVDSLWTQVGDMLTNHLNAADFLNTKEHPTAKFESTEIKPGKEPGTVDIKGKFTLMGQTKEITFPATVKIDDDGLVLTSQFDLDRTLFGMAGHTNNVEEVVKMSVVVGQPSTRGAEEAAKDKAAAGPQAKASGLMIGEEVSPWEPVHVAGPDKGTTTCPICTYMTLPAVVAFAKPGSTTDRLIAQVEELLADHQAQKLKGFVAVLDASPMMVRVMGSTSDLKLTSLCYLDPATRDKVLADYKILPAAENTVMVYKDYKVVANFNDLDVAREPRKLEQAVAAMLR